MVVKLILSVISQAVTQLLRWNLIDINKLSMFNSSIQSTSQSKYLKLLYSRFWQRSIHSFNNLWRELNVYAPLLMEIRTDAINYRLITGLSYSSVLTERGVFTMFFGIASLMNIEH